MHKILWVLLFISILVCYGTWLTLEPKPLNSSSHSSAKLLQDQPSQQIKLVKKQVYNQLLIALPKTKLAQYHATLLNDATLRIPVKTSVNGRLAKSFKNALSKLVPSYFKIVSHPHFSEHIESITIEAHTSSDWKNSNNRKERFQKNKVLSNQQARAVENYLYDLIELNYLHQWMSFKLATIGRSSQNLIYTEGKEDRNKSKRIEIRIKFK